MMKLLKDTSRAVLSVLFLAGLLFATHASASSTLDVASDDYRHEKSFIWSEVDYGWTPMEDRGALHVYSRASNSRHAILVLEGQIPEDSIVEKFTEAVAKRDAVILVIDSTGGSSLPAEDIADMIRKLEKEKRWFRDPVRFLTYLPKDGMSHSAASIIYLSTAMRWRHEGAKLGIHASSAVGTMLTPTEEMEEWIRFGIPRGLAESLLREGVFEAGADYRTLDEIEMYRYELGAPLRSSAAEGARTHARGLRCQSLFSSEF